MKKLLLLTVCLLLVLSVVAQDRIFTRNAGTIDCRITVINYVENVVKYRLANSSQVSCISIDIIDGLYMAEQKSCLRRNNLGEFQPFEGTITARPLARQWLCVGAALRCGPLTAGGLTAGFTNWFDHKNGIQLSFLANRMYRRQQQLIVNAGQVYGFAEFTQQYFNPSSASAFYWTLGAGASYQGGDLWITGVEYSDLYGITNKEEGNDFHDWQFCLPQLTFSVGCQIFNRSGRGAWDLAIRYISPELTRGRLVSLREKLGSPRTVDGFYVTAGYRFGL